jgi:hypothetical protein
VSAVPRGSSVRAALPANTASAYGPSARSPFGGAGGTFEIASHLGYDAERSRACRRRGCDADDQSANCRARPRPRSAPSGEACALPAQVVWCIIVGRKQKLGGESHLVARSGLRFTRLTGAQPVALTATLQDLAAALQPIA